MFRPKSVIATVIEGKEVAIVGAEVVIVEGLIDLNSWSELWIATVKILAFP
jgi:hypothetical protein